MGAWIPAIATLAKHLSLLFGQTGHRKAEQRTPGCRAGRALIPTTVIAALTVIGAETVT